MLFGTAFFLLNLGRNEETSVIPSHTGFWVTDAFQNQYELGIGEFQNENFGEGNYGLLFYILFIFATFFIQIVFLNMMIAIMGDTYTQETDQRFYSRRVTKIQSMAQYVHLIHRDVDNNNSNDSSDAVENDTKQELLYVVFLVDESVQENIWDGQVSEIK